MDDEEYQNITKKEELIQKLSEFPPRDRDGNEVEAILTKCILIMEWTDVEGRQWLSKAGVTGSGGVVSVWDQNGMLYQALNGNW